MIYYFSDLILLFIATGRGERCFVPTGHTLLQYDSILYSLKPFFLSFIRIETISVRIFVLSCYNY